MRRGGCGRAGAHEVCVCVCVCVCRGGVGGLCVRREKSGMSRTADCMDLTLTLERVGGWGCVACDQE